jgi:hypothetical protein
MCLLHSYVPVAAMQREEPVPTDMTRVTGEYAAGIAIPKTDILWRCSGCGRVKSTDIHGRWSLDQIRGQQ